MRNLKRALSLAMASVMLLGMMVVGTSASFPDVKSSDNVEAINVVQLLSVMTGDDKGNFNASAKLTRNEMAVVMCNLLGLKPADYAGTCKFTDVPDWAKNYVAACYANSIVSGATATTYNGNGNVTTVEASLMMLKALGYFQNKEDFYDDWKLSVVKKAADPAIKLLDGISTAADVALTRNDVAKLALNTLKSDVVYFSGTKGSNVTTSDGTSINMGYSEKYTVYGSTVDYTTGSTTGDGTLQLCEKLYESDLKLSTGSSDDFGHPANVWTYKSNDVTAAKTAKVTLTAKTSASNVATALSGYSIDSNASSTVVDAVKVNNTTKYVTSTNELAADVKIFSTSKTATATSLTINASSPGKTIAEVIAALTENGKKVEFFANSDNVITDIVVTAYTVAKVNTVTTAKDKVTYTFSNSVASGIDYVEDLTADTISIMGTIAKGDYVTAVKPAGSTVLYVYPTTNVTGTQTSKTNDGKITVAGTQYTVASGVNSVGTFNNSDKDAVYYIDQFGYAVATTSTAASSDYAFVLGTDGKLTTTIDGATPSAEARIMLADGSVAVYTVAVEKLKTGNALIGQAASNTDLNSGINLAVDDYVIKGTKICVYDATYGASGASNDDASVKTAVSKLLSGTYGYSISDKTITLEGLTTYTSTTAVDTTYSVTLTTAKVQKDKTSYAENSKTILVDRNTKFVVYNADKKTATVYTGATNLPTAIGTATAPGSYAGYAVLKSSSSSADVGTASVVFVSTSTGLSADSTDKYVYINATKYSETLVDGSAKYVYTGTYADGTTITLAPGAQIGSGVANDSGLFTYDEANKVNTTRLSAAQYINATSTKMLVSGDLVGVGSTYYNITEDTKIVYINSDLAEVNDNYGWIVLEVNNGTVSSDVETIFVTAD